MLLGPVVRSSLGHNNQNHFKNKSNFGPPFGRPPSAGSRSWEAGFAPGAGASVGNLGGQGLEKPYFNIKSHYFTKTILFTKTTFYIKNAMLH